MRPASSSSIDQLVTSEPGVLGGTVVFVGTRVPFTTLIEYLETGQTLDEFVSDFPGVTRAQAVAALEAVRLMVEDRASAA